MSEATPPIDETKDTDETIPLLPPPAPEPPPPLQPIVLTEDDIRKYCSDVRIVNLIKKQFSRISTFSAVKLTEAILQNRIKINANDISKKTGTSKTLVHQNNRYFDSQGFLTPDTIKDLKLKTNGLLLELHKQPIKWDTTKSGDAFLVNKNATYDDTRRFICEERGEAVISYDFKNPDLQPVNPASINTLQRVQIQVISLPIKFDYPIEYIYTCTQCRVDHKKKPYETVSTNNRIKCDGLYNYVAADGTPKTKICTTTLAPDNEISETKSCFYYDMSYEDDEGNKRPASAISFQRYRPGFYDCVLFKIKNPKRTEFYQIIDIMEIKSNPFTFPEKEENRNYIFTLIDSFDAFIKKQTGMEIYGLLPIKAAMILQGAVANLGIRLTMNCQVSGSASTGKSTILKYYGVLLHNHLNMSTNGLSISVPGLRGTREVISLMGREQKINTTGHLGTYKAIHIDEAGENKELVQNLKTFLLEDNYSYDKAGSTGTFKKRTAHVNLSENLDHNHVGQYRGAIRKAYKESNITIGDEEKIVWDESWDLHLPLFSYDNPYLRKVIKEKRLEYQSKQMFWIDGYDYALHERFPLYFYLDNAKKDEKLTEVIKGNAARDRLSENMDLMRALKSEDIDNFFKDINKYKEGKNDIESFAVVDKILDDYGVRADVRTKEFYYTLVKISRILNKRDTVIEEDYNLLKWLLEKTHRKLDVVDTTDYKIEGPPDLAKQEEIDLKIEEETKEADDEFGLPAGDFDGR